MPTKIRRRRRESRNALTAYRACELLNGPAENYDLNQIARIGKPIARRCWTVGAAADPYDFFAWRPWLSVDRDPRGFTIDRAHVRRAYRATPC